MPLLNKMQEKNLFKSMFKEGRDLGMLMISANWLGLEWLLWKKGNQTLSVICLEILFSQAAFRCPVPGLTYLHAVGILLHYSVPGRAVHAPAGLSCARGAAARRCGGAARSRGDNGKAQLGAALALSLSPSTATQAAPPQQFTTSRSSPAARKWLGTF